MQFPVKSVSACFSHGSVKTSSTAKLSLNIFHIFGLCKLSISFLVRKRLGKRKKKTSSLNVNDLNCCTEENKVFFLITLNFGVTEYSLFIFFSQKNIQLFSNPLVPIKNAHVCLLCMDSAIVSFNTIIHLQTLLIERMTGVSHLRKLNFQAHKTHTFMSIGTRQYSFMMMSHRCNQ